MNLTLPLTVGAAVVLLSSTAAVLTPREPHCRLDHDQPAASAPALPLDPAHAARDLADVEREAEQFGRAVAARPPASDSIDAKAGARSAPMRAVAWCRVTLIAELARIHHVDASTLVSAGAVNPAQAEADRTNRVDATSSVVSRPSR